MSQLDGQNREPVPPLAPSAAGPPRDVTRSPVRAAVEDSAQTLRLAACLAAAGLVWTVASTYAGAGVFLWLAGHVVMLAVGVIVTSVSARGDKDVSGDVVVLLATSVLGPVGAALAGLAVFAATRMQTDEATLAAWYKRISDAGDVDRVTRLATAVSVGRSVNVGSPVPQSFHAVIADGSMAERQNALGLIARRFAPAYAPALHAALVSSEPVVRVQAAAVAVKVKAELAIVVDTLVRSGVAMEAPRAIEAASSLDAMVATGLLDTADENRAIAAIATILARATTEPSIGEWSSKASLEARQLLETEFLRQRRWAEFRAIRAISTPPNTGTNAQLAFTPPKGVTV